MTLDIIACLILAGVVLSATVGYHASLTLRNAKLREAIQTGCQTAGSLAYFILVNSKEAAAVEVILAHALEAGLKHVNDALPDTLSKLNITQDTLMNMVKGALATLLAADPAISPVVLQHLKTST